MNWTIRFSLSPYGHHFQFDHPSRIEEAKLVERRCRFHSNQKNPLVSLLIKEQKLESQKSNYFLINRIVFYFFLFPNLSLRTRDPSNPLAFAISLSTAARNIILIADLLQDIFNKFAQRFQDWCPINNYCVFFNY